MEKRLLILGAGRGQLGLIKAAKKLGITTIVGTLPDNNPPGIQLADEVCYMNIADPDDVVAKAKRLNLDGVATCCLDTGVPALGRTVDELELCGLNESAAKLCFDKYNMKKALISNHVNTARFYPISDDAELGEALDKLSLPVIIKATDLQGSRGIYRAHTEEEAYIGFHNSLKDTKRDFCVIEEYIEGWEFGAQAFIYNGEILFVLPHGDNTYMSHTAVPVGHFVPLDCDPVIIEKAIIETKAAIKALGLNNCAVNVDLIAKDNVVYIIELTGRAGANCLPELVGINFGINYYEMIALMAVGDDPRKVFDTRQSKTMAGLAKMIFSTEQSGIIKNIFYETDDDNNVLEVSFFKHAGDEMRKFVDSNDCIGQIIVKGENLSSCEKKMKDIYDRIHIELM